MIVHMEQTGSLVPFRLFVIMSGTKQRTKLSTIIALLLFWPRRENRFKSHFFFIQVLTMFSIHAVLRTQEKMAEKMTRVCWEDDEEGGLRR